MKLPFLSKKKDGKEYFLALLFSSNDVKSLLFEKTGESLLIIAAKKEEFEEPLDLLTSERLIELSDIVISSVEEALPEASLLDKTIFAVPHRWVVDGKIIKEELMKLKSLCEALHLTPVGFIVSIEAIIAYLHKKQGVPVTAIFVEIGKKHVTLSIAKNGTVLLVEDQEIEKSPIETVEKILSSQEVLDVLPSKIILLNFEHAKKTQQTFLSHSWGKNLSFLHIPQVEVLDTEIESQAVISGVAAQMGFAMLPDMDLSHLEKHDAPVTVASDQTHGDSNPEPEKDETIDGTDTSEESTHEPLKDDTEEIFNGENVGFLKEVDILKKDEAEEKTEEQPEANISEPQQVQHAVSTQELTHVMPEGGLPHFSKPNLPHISFQFPKISIPGLKGGKSSFMYPALAVILFIGLIVGYYFFFEKVQVEAYLDKKDIHKELSVSFSKDGQTASKDAIIHMDVVDIKTDGKEEQSATGKKTTGEKAAGVVTLYNKTDSPKTFSKGTSLQGPNNLIFNLTDDVKVASTSSFSTTFSSTDAKVTADTFGKEYNLPSASNFQVKGESTSDYFGKNSNAFTGGTKKDITVVSVDDVASLQEKILDTLSKKAVSDAISKEGSSMGILPVPVDYTFDEKAYSKKAGDAADTVSLSASITFQLGSYKKDDLVEFVKAETAKDVPSDYTYSGKDSEIKIQNAKETDGKISGKLVFSSVFLPHVDTDGVRAKIAGKSFDKANSLIQTDGVTDDRITFTRSLPFFPKILPFNKNNIVIVEKTQ